MEDMKLREGKLKVDIRTFDKQKNQQKMLNRFSKQYSGSSSGSRGSVSSQRESCSSKSSKNSWGSRSCSRSSDFSKLMAPDPRAEVRCPATNKDNLVCSKVCLVYKEGVRQMSITVSVTNGLVSISTLGLYLKMVNIWQFKFIVLVPPCFWFFLRFTQT